MVESRRPGPDDKPASLGLTDLLVPIIRRYNAEVHTPELITATWGAVYDNWVSDARRRGISVPDIHVPSLEAPQRELESSIPDVKGDLIPSLMIYYPPQLQGRDGIITMGEMFPRLQTRTVKKDTPLQNAPDESGWLNVEAVGESPNADTTEEQLRRHFESQGRAGMNENQYVVLAQFMSLTKGNFPDQRILNRLVGSKTEGYVINSRFGSKGDLHVNSHLRPSLHGWELGGRSVKVIQKDK